MPQLSGGGGDPELCATDEMIPFKDEGDPHKEQIFAELSHSEEEGDLADIKSSLVNESESSPNSNSHDVSTAAGSTRWGRGMMEVGVHSELHPREREGERGRAVRVRPAQLSCFNRLKTPGFRSNWSGFT